jgi:flagellar biosynthesis protein FlhB
MAEKKSFGPSKKRIREARRQGSVVRSPLLTGAVGVTVCYVVFFYGNGWLWIKNQMLLQYVLVQGVESIVTLPRAVLFTVLKGTLIILVPGALVGVLFELVVVGLRFEWHPLLPALTRFDPIGGFSRIGRGCAEIWITTLHLMLLGAGAGLFFWIDGVVPYAVTVHRYEVVEGWLLGAGKIIALIGCTAFCVAGGVEYFWRRDRFFREHSMSLEDVRREHREEEGDPIFRAHRRSQQRELALQDLATQVRKAKVIIVERAA